MNLHLHGCASVETAAALRFLGLIRSVTIFRTIPNGEVLTFVVAELEFSAHLEIGDILLARAARHSFVENAFVRMETDQYSGFDRVVFGRDYLESLPLDRLTAVHSRSACDWHEPTHRGAE